MLRATSSMISCVSMIADDDPMTRARAQRRRGILATDLSTALSHRHHGQDIHTQAGRYPNEIPRAPYAHMRPLQLSTDPPPASRARTRMSTHPTCRARAMLRSWYLLAVGIAVLLLASPPFELACRGGTASRSAMTGPIVARAAKARNGGGKGAFQCPPGFFRHKATCMAAFDAPNNQILDVHSAQELCEGKFDSKLAWIQSAEENQLATRACGPGNPCFIGLQCEIHTRLFKDSVTCAWGHDDSNKLLPRDSFFTSWPSSHAMQDNSGAWCPPPPLPPPPPPHCRVCPLVYVHRVCYPEHWQVVSDQLPQHKRR